MGDRVALPWLGDACGHCRYCVAGWETYCTSPQYMGYTMDGSYAEYAVGNASHVVRVPDGVSSFDAAPLTCAGVTTYKALKVAHPQPGETAMVVGIGGLGHLGLQYAKIFGTTTVAVDVDDAKLQLAKDLGADHVVDARGDQAAQLAAIGGVDIALVTVPSPQAMRAAHAALNPNGRLVLVGLPADNRLEIPVFETVLKGISVIGSLVGTRNDVQDCFALHAQGRTRVVAEAASSRTSTRASRRCWRVMSRPDWSSTSPEQRGRVALRGVDPHVTEGRVDLYWLPLGAGGRCVGANGRMYEGVVARLAGREPLASTTPHSRSSTPANAS